MSHSLNCKNANLKTVLIYYEDLFIPDIFPDNLSKGKDSAHNVSYQF